MFKNFQERFILKLECKVVQLKTINVIYYMETFKQHLHLTSN